MPTTGQDLLNRLKQKVSQDYTGTLSSTVKANRIFSEALVEAIEFRYRQLSDQKDFDEISNLIITGLTVTPTNNQVNLSGTTAPTISDYHHLLTVKVKYTDPIYIFNVPLTVTSATNTSPVTVTLDRRSNVRTGDRLSFAGATGNTQINGERYVRKVNSFDFDLYSDADLQTSVGFNGTYTGGATVSRVYYKTARLYRSDLKGSEFEIPTVREPYYETVTNLLKVYPTAPASQEIEIDYIRTIQVEIDTANNTTDLELTYPLKFLLNIVDRAATLFASEVRDTEEYQMSKLEQQENP